MITIGISSKTRKLLWGKSGNRCAMCREVLSIPESGQDKQALIGEECHIISKAKQGPRYKEMSNFDYDSYGNLILLCKNHHSQIDQQWETYSVELLKNIKENHEKWVSNKLQKSENEPVIFKRLEDNIPKKLDSIEDGKTLFSLLNNAYAHYFDYDEIRNDVEQELIEKFADLVSQIIDVSDIYEGGSIIQVHQTLDKKINQLHENELLLFGAVEIMYLSGGESPTDSSWKVVHLKIVHLDSDEINQKNKEEA